MAQHKTIDRRAAKQKTTPAPAANAGREHRVIDRRKTGQKKTATVPTAPAPSVQAGREHKVIDRRQAGQKQTVAVPAAGAKNRTAQTGGYYSPREYGGQTGAYEARVTAARTAMEEQGKNLRTSQTEVENLWKAAQDAQTAYQNCRGMFKGASAAQYEQQFLTRWTEAAQSYSQRYQQFEQEYAAYKPYEDAYNAALGEYNAYVAAERAEYDRWRGSIRGAEEIRAEQSQIKSKRAELQRLMQEQNAIASGTAAPGIQAKAAQNEQRIAELQAYLGGVGDREGLLKEELDWSEHFRFEDLRQNRDFYERSRYREGGGGSLYNQVNTRPGRFHNEFFRDDAFAGIYGRMTDQEVDIHNYLHETQGEEAAKEYIAYLTPELNRRKVEEDTGAIREWSGRNPVNAALATAGSVLLSPLSGIEGAAGMIAAKLRGEEIDPNAAYAQAANWKNAAREDVTERIEKNLGEFWGPVGSFAYNTGVSMMDMLADSVAGPGAMALIGTRAFSEGTMDAKKRGLSDEQALVMGASSATAELLTERLGVDEILHLPKKWETAGFWKGALRGAIGEGVEEGLTNLANLAADMQIAGEKGEFMQSVHAYREQNMDDQEAVIAALKDAGISLALDALGGAVSGGVFGGRRGYQGKKATEAQEKAGKAAKPPEGEMPPQSQSDSSPIPDGTGEPLGDGTQAVPYERNAAPDNGTTAPDNGTVREDRTAGNTGKQEATGAKNAQAVQEDVQKGPETVAGTDADLTATAQRVQPGSLKAVVMESVNPLITGKLHTAQTEQLARLVGNAQTDQEVMEATAKVYGASSETVQQVKTAMELTGLTRVVFDHGESTGGKRAAAWFDPETRVIHIDPAAKSPTLVLYGHEMTHRIEQTDGYNSFSQLVLDRIEDSGTDLAALRAEKRAEYAQGGRKLSDSDVDREIVAQYAAENLLSNEADIRALVDRSRTLGQRIRECLDYWLAKLGNRDAQERQFLTKARDLYVQALDQSDKLDERYIREQERVAEAREMGLSEEEYDTLRELDEEDLGDGDDANALSAGMDLMLEDDKGDTVKKQLTENQDSLNNMEPVAEITTPSGFWRLNKTQKQNWIIEKLRPTGYKVDRSDFGVIEFVEKRLKSAFNYLRKGSAEEAVFEALPMVLEKGIEISRHTNHKGREYGTVTLAAPIVVNGIRGNMAAVVKCTTGNLYKVHRVLSPDGSVFVLPEIKEEAEPTPGGGVIREDPLATPISSASNNIIQELNDNVKQMQDIGGHTGSVEYALEDNTDKAGGAIPEAARFSEFERTMPTQVQRSLKMARNELVRTVGKALGVSANDRNGKLKLAAENLNNEYIMHDVVSRESIEAFWDQAVELGTVEPTEEARAAFDEAIRKLEQTYERATRYLNELYEQQVPEDGAEEESRTPPPAPEPEAELTPEEAEELMKQCKKARSKADRLAKMAMLRDSDKEKIHLLLRGEMQPHELDPSTDNVADILEVYEARKEYEELAKQVRQYKGKIKKRRTDTADKLTATVTSWKDKKSGFGYSRETMERNVRDIVGSKRLAKKINAEYFEPVHKAAAAELKFKAEMRARVEKLNISTKVAKGNTHSESYAVQFLGEALSHIQVLEKSRNMNARREGKTLREWEAEVGEFRRQNPNLDETSIRAKIQEFRKIYDELLEQVNTVRISNGYEPVNRIEGYFPHFQMMEQTGFWGGVKKALGFKADITPLPATINGRTAGFKPGIRWMANAQARTGFQTTYDAIEGFERYLNSAADVIYLTDCIQNLRAFASQIRYNASPEGLRKQIDRINANPDMDEEQRRDAIEQVYKKGKFAGSHFVAELDEYTNLLAGKRSAGDREMERLFGRGAYNVAKWAEQKTGANMVGANIGSALTNFIPMTQGFAVLKSQHFFRGMADTMRGEWKRDGFRGNSTFLTNRMGETRLATTWMDKASNVAGGLMEWIDMLSAETITRGRYYQNLSRDMSEQAAMDEADAWAAALMGDRSKGGMPTIFQQSNPVAKLFTQFQLEVNNQFSFMLKDIPKDFEDEVIKHIALFLLKWILSQYLFNDVYEYFVGRRPAFDVGNMVNEFVGDLTGYELPNLIELGIHAAKGEELGFETEKEGFGGALTNLAGNVAEELPFTPAANLIGIEIDGGRVPVASAIPDLSVIGDVIGNPDWSWEKRWKELGDELAKPLTYMIPPFGGGQAKKAVEAASAYWQNGRYTMDKDGNLLLQFPMGSVPDAVQAALFGTTSTKAGREWVEDGFGSLTAKQTQAYKSLVDGGMDVHEAYGIISTLRTAEKTDEQSRTQVQRQLLMESGLTDSQKQTVYRVMISGDYDEKIAKFREAGMDMDDFLTAQLQHGAIKTQYEDEGDMATAFARWVNQQGYSASQKQVIRDCFKYWKMMPADADRYDRGIEAGLSDADAAELVEDLKAVTPLEGEDNVKQYQNWRVAIDNAVNEKNQLTLLKSVGMNDASYAKCEAAWGQGIAPAAYVRAKELESQFNEDGKGSLKNTEWTQLIDSMTTTGIVLAGDNTRFHLTNEQKGFLWQMLTGSKSTKNNPYSVRGGEKWLEIKEEMEEEEEE